MEIYVDQRKLEIQLDVWKELAIKKQMLIATATDALGLDPDCDSEELRAGLQASIKRVMDADNKVAEAQEQATQAMNVLKQKMTDLEKEQAQIEDKLSQALNDNKNAEQTIEAGKLELQKVKKQLGDKTKELKDINVALADTPANVIKKLKDLKKQKIDEANARKRVEGELRNSKKETQKQEAKVAELEATIKTAATLSEKYTELHSFSQGQYDQLKAAGTEALNDVPALETELVETIEKAAKTED
jgi:chromosome segregation ATPase